MLEEFEVSFGVVRFIKLTFVGLTLTTVARPRPEIRSTRGGCVAETTESSS